jgi:ADP-ribose pyrophosphatase YjhB (NUDIX family)
MTDDATFDDVTDWAFTDPETLRERTDVLFRQDTRVVNDPSEFNGREAWAGMVVVGVVNDAGEVLLVNAPHGWTLPVSPVEPGEEWAAVGRRWVAQKTGVAVDIDRPERVTRIAYRLAESEHRQTTGYDVVFRAEPENADAPESAETPMDHLNAKRASDDGDEWDARWFDHVPEGVEDHEDIVSDIEWFLED